LDVHVTRCADLSPLIEAEHLNGAETSAVAMAKAPSMLAAGVPKNSAELKRNAREFGQAQTNAISVGKYGTRSLEAWALAGASASLLGIEKEREW